MKAKKFVKSLLLRAGAIAVIFLAPILWSAFGLNGYFEGGLVCGYPTYLYIQDDKLWECAPYCGGSQTRGTLHEVDGGWEIQPTVPVNKAFLVIVPQPTNNPFLEVAPQPTRLRLVAGDLYESGGRGTNSFRHARVYNIWRVWFQRCFADPDRGPRKAQKINCVNNLKQIGLAFRIWAGDNDDKYPFNVTTNAGGTMELCARGPNDIDTNSYRHFQVMSNELSTCALLICPKDKSKTMALNFGTLSVSNVTYRMRTGSDVNETNPRAILVVCPADGNILYCDGSVKEHGW